VKVAANTESDTIETQAGRNAIVLPSPFLANTRLLPASPNVAADIRQNTWCLAGTVKIL
jgi:hypothetical protein